MDQTLPLSRYAPKHLLKGALMVISLFPATLAVATPESSILPPAPPPLQRQSYGGWVLLADFVGFFAAIGGAPTFGLKGSAIMFALPSPTVHLLYHNPGRAAASLALHLCLPAGGAYLGWNIDLALSDPGAPGSEFGSVGGAFVGALLGIAAATTLDAGLLARQAGDPIPPSSHRGLALVPRLSVTPRGSVWVGLGGRI